MTRASAAHGTNDSHLHLGMDDEHGADGGLGAYLALMEKHQIARACIVTPSARGADNSVTVQAVREHPDRFTGIGLLDLTDRSAAAQAANLLDQGLHGFRFTLRGESPTAETTFLNDAVMRRVIRIVEERGGTMAFHCAPDRLALLVPLLEQHRELCVLIDHGGRPVLDDPSYPTHRALQQLADFPSVVVKTPNSSAFSRQPGPHRDLVPFHSWLVRTFGADRVMWGSDWPVCLAGGPYQAALAAAETALSELSPAERRLVMGGTFARVFGEGDAA